MSESVGAAVRSAQQRLQGIHGDTEADATSPCCIQYTLRFRLTSAMGDPFDGIPYRTYVSGQPPINVHVKDNMTNTTGTTQIVSTTQGESIDFYISWASVTVINPF